MCESLQPAKPTHSAADEACLSEILHGKRHLALSHVQKLAAYFHVSPATFIDDLPPDRATHAAS